MVGGSSPRSSTQTHSRSSVPPKSKFIFTTYFFSKSLIVILVLLVFFFFPSQVPEIFKETTILTKLWELIYLLVIGIAVCYGLFSTRKSDGIHTDSSDGSFGENEAYLSGISHISSIFEHGIQNSYGFEENSTFEECKGLGSRVSEIGESDGKKKKKKKKANQYLLGESMVVINDENYVLEQLGGQKRIRNLGSKSLDSAAAAGKSAVEDSSSLWDDNRKGKFRGLVPIKLEQKFKETDSDSDCDSDSRIRINWRSKSMRLGKREDMFTANANRVLDFEGLKSKSKRFETPSKMKNLSERQDPKGVEPNHRYMKSYPNGESSFMESIPLESRTDAFSEMNNPSSSTEILKDFKGELDGSFKQVPKDFDENKVDGGAFDSKHNSQFVKSKSQSSSTGAYIPDPIQKPATTANVYKKGKSVRTSRSKEQVLESKVKTSLGQTDDKVEPKAKLGTDEMNVRADEMSDTEPHSGEVDRKAEEFIAKFREQIRLQKVASARKLNLL